MDWLSFQDFLPVQKFNFFSKFLAIPVDSSITRTSSFCKNYNFITSINSVMTTVTSSYSFWYSATTARRFLSRTGSKDFIMKFSGLKHTFSYPHCNNCPIVRNPGTASNENFSVRVTTDTLKQYAVWPRGSGLTAAN